MDLIYRALDSFELFILILVRTSGVIMAMPLLGHQLVPMRVKVLMIVAIAMLLCPVLAPVSTPKPAGMVCFVLVMVKELAIGLVLGLAATMALTAARIAGEIVSHEIGFGMSQILDPGTQTSSSPLGQFLFMTFMLLFLQANGHHWFLRALAASYDAIPIGGLTLRGCTAEKMIGCFSGMYVTAVKIAAPMLAAALLVTAGIALVARTVPQMNILVMGYPVKIVVSLLILVGLLPFVTPVASRLFHGVHRDLLFILKSMG